jgi:hypothetical protein
MFKSLYKNEIMKWLKIKIISFIMENLINIVHLNNTFQNYK